MRRAAMIPAAHSAAAAMKMWHVPVATALRCAAPAGAVTPVRARADRRLVPGALVVVE
jgi:hypothetical protein